MGEAPLPQRARSYWKARFSAAAEGLERLLEAERAQLPPWLAVGFGFGIAAWFALGEPVEWRAFLCIAAALTLAGFVFGTGRAGRSLGWFALAATLGCALVWARSVWVAQPRLQRPAVVEFVGKVVSVDHLAAKQTVRLLLHPTDAALPPQVRVSVDEDKMPAGAAPGAEVKLRARLAPPPPMALPGTYDFARDAWFRGIGAVGKSLGPVALQVPGRHNVLNALAAAAVGLDLEMPFDRIQTALAAFAGVQRRFQIRGEAQGVLVVDDYGHHPAEIRATLAAAKAGFDRRVITVFQPHRYSRTQHLRNDFLTAFYQSDVLIVMDIYAAGEAPIEGVHARDLADGIAAHGHREVLYLGGDRAAIVDYLYESTRAGDLVLTLGAGDVGLLGGELLKRLGPDPGTTSKRR